MLGGHAEDGELMWPSMEAIRELFSLTFFFTNFFQAQCLLRKISVVSGVSHETVLALLFLLFLLLINDYSDSFGQITGFSMTESSTEE